MSNLNPLSNDAVGRLGAPDWSWEGQCTDTY